MRVRFDSQDFVQQVWKSFFVGDNRLPDFQSPDDLIAYLQAMARQKINLETRRQHARKNDIAREQEIDPLASTIERHPAASDPTPSTIAVFNEQYNRLVEQQEPEVREVAVLRAQGATFPEIAESLQMHEATARRLMRRVRRRAMQDEQPPDD
jgi:DNA-directed RNA polymerase specialized sigma24 family protein